MLIRSDGFTVNRLRMPVFEVPAGSMAHCAVPFPLGSPEFHLLGDLLKGKIEHPELRLAEPACEIPHPAFIRYRHGGFWRRRSIKNYLKFGKGLEESFIARVLQETGVDPALHTFRISVKTRFLIELEIGMARANTIFFHTAGLAYDGLTLLTRRLDEGFLKSGGTALCFSTPAQYAKADIQVEVSNNAESLVAAILSNPG